MINKQEVLRLAQKQRLLPTIIEKDYVLSWILSGIANHPQLSRHWVFKGGTCIKKCYIENYRFSEDLDFTVKSKSPINIPFLNKAFKEVLRSISQQSGIVMFLESLKFEKHRELSVQGSFSYQGPLMMQQKAKPKIKLDLTADELLVMPPESIPIFHNYSDKALFTSSEIFCYSFEELFAEKMRALTERLRPRDLYDVVNLFHFKKNVNPQSFINILKKKCDHKRVTFPTFRLLENHFSRNNLTISWENMLSHQISPLAPLDAFWSQLPLVFSWIDSLLE